MGERGAAKKSTDETKIPIASTGTIAAILHHLYCWRETWQVPRKIPV
jgi:hypothetical protein